MLTKHTDLSVKTVSQIEMLWHTKTVVMHSMQPKTYIVLRGSTPWVGSHFVIIAPHTTQQTYSNLQLWRCSILTEFHQTNNIAVLFSGGRLK